MPIRIKCPNCQKGLAIKDQLAGKKVSCPVCKTILQVPKPMAAPADVEELAAAALQDSPAPAATPTSSGPDGAASAPAPAKTIDFSCPFCDAELHLPFDLGGKREPCPECKHILQVPKPVEDKPKDWRTVQKKGPSAALINQQPELEGAWGTATHKGRVSQQALIEADVIEVDREYIGVVGWIKRGFWAAVVLGVATLVIVNARQRGVERRQTDALAQALGYLEGKVKLPPSWTAEIHRAAAEFYTLRKEAKKAREFVSKARKTDITLTGKEAPSLDQDALLIELANNLVELGGSPSEVQDNKRLDWKDIDKELQRTLEAIRSPDARVLALRQVGTKLMAREQGSLAIGLAVKIRSVEGAAGGGATAQEIALLLAREETALASKLAKPPEISRGPLDPIARQGYAEGRARQGSWKEALDIANAKGPPPQRLQAALGVALLALHDSTGSGTANLPPAATCCFDALAEMKYNASPWTLLQLVKIAAQTETPDKVKKLVDLPGRDKDFKARAQLELLYSQLAKMTGRVDPQLVEEVADKNSLARALAWEAIARLNSRLGYQEEILARLPEIEEKCHPFIYAGVALGELDAQK